MEWKGASVGVGGERVRVQGSGSGRECETEEGSKIHIPGDTQRVNR